MDKPLTPETQSQIRALCESIAQRDKLGEDVQEELRCHIEDKVIGYLDGLEVITEQDAVILAREHFGNPAVLKSMLQKTHVEQFALGMARRIGVATLLLVSLEFTTRSLFLVIQVLIASFGEIATISTVYSYFAAGIAALEAIGFWILLKKSIDARSASVFTTVNSWNRRQLARALTIAMVALILLPRSSFAPGMFANVLPLPGIVAVLVSFAAAIAMGVIWVRYCDGPPYSVRTAANAAIAWGIVAFALWTLADGFSPIRLTFTPEELAGLPLLRDSSGTYVYAVWHSPMLGLATIAKQFIWTFPLTAVLTVIAFAAYAISIRRRIAHSRTAVG